jgi:hypothetical protein
MRSERSIWAARFLTGDITVAINATKILANASKQNAVS